MRIIPNLQARQVDSINLPTTGSQAIKSLALPSVWAGSAWINVGETQAGHIAFRSGGSSERQG